MCVVAADSGIFTTGKIHEFNMYGCCSLKHSGFYIAPMLNIVHVVTMGDTQGCSLGWGGGGQVIAPMVGGWEGVTPIVPVNS